MNERQQLEAAVAALEAQRDLVGDAVTDAALAPMRRRLAGIIDHEQSLRVVTVLFMDVVGSTALSRRLDPEEIHTLIDGALHRLTAIVEEHQGRVLQYAGDSLLAVFGAAESREDDPDRAVHCGLAIAQAAQHIGGEVRAACPGGDFNVRVGIHTGSVLLGGGIDEASTIRGIAVNIAARMEQTAPAGGVRISHETQRHVRGKFNLTDETPIVVKGFAEPMRSHLVMGAMPREFSPVGRGVEGIAVAMVGRDAELAKLTDTFETACVDRKLQLITLSGDPGLGKTRLLAEFERWLDSHQESAVRLYGRALPYSNSAPYGLVRDMLTWHFGILDSDSLTLAHNKLQQGFGLRFGARGAEQASLVGRLIGMDCAVDPHMAGIEGDGRQLRDRAFSALAQYLRLLHDERGAPVVVLLDDLHWADDGSLDFISHVARACKDAPVLLICSTRPELFERRPKWSSGGNNHQRVALEPLSRRSSRELVQALLARLDAVPAALRDLVTSTAEGNPYFLEELIGMLLDEGVLVAQGERWGVEAERLVQVRVPSTLSGVLQARLDTLPPQELATLQHASVIGHVFWDEVLERMAPLESQVLDSLTRRDLARERDTSSIAGAHEYAFKHHLLHRVTYDGVLKRDKREKHRLTAEWLIVRSGERANEYLGLIADHYEKAGDSAKAIEYFRKAASDATRSFAIEVALSYFDRILALLTDPGERFDTLLKRLVVAYNRRVGDTHLRMITEMEELAESLNDDGRRALAASFRATYAAGAGDLVSTEIAAKKAIALAQITGRTAAAIRAHNQWGRKLAEDGDLDGAQLRLEQGLSLSRSSSNWVGETSASVQLSRVAQARGRFDEARRYAHAALQLARTNGDEPYANWIECGLADIDMSVGHFDRATQQLQTVLKAFRSRGWSEYEADALVRLAKAALLQGEATEAAGWLDQAIAVDPGNEGPDFRFATEMLRGDVCRARRLSRDAESAYGRAAEACCNLHRPLVVLEIEARLARLAQENGDLIHAKDHVAVVVERWDAGWRPESVDMDSMQIMLTCYQVLAAVGDQQALEFLAAAYKALRARADCIDASERDAFMNKLTVNREIMTAWNQLNSAEEE